jgi:hypothetical protein
MEEAYRISRLTDRLPQAPEVLAGYIHRHYPKAFLWEISTWSDPSHQLVYKVELSDLNKFYHLRFSIEGKLMDCRVEWMLEQEMEESNAPSHLFAMESTW